MAQVIFIMRFRARGLKLNAAVPNFVRSTKNYYRESIISNSFKKLEYRYYCEGNNLCKGT